MKTGKKKRSNNNKTEANIRITDNMNKVTLAWAIGAPFQNIFVTKELQENRKQVICWIYVNSTNKKLLSSAIL